MFTPALVQAQVVDIRNPASVPPPDLVVDANVLYCLFYPNFSALTYARGKNATPFQLPNYSSFWKRAALAGTRFHVATASLWEFAKTAEFAELEAIWLMDPTAPQPNPSRPVRVFDPRVCKFARYHYVKQLRLVRNAVQAMIASVLKSVSLLPQFPTADAQHHLSTVDWLQSSGDFPDAVMVATAKDQKLAGVLSDDIDLATFAGISLYTANPTVITAAGTAGKIAAPPKP